MKIQLLAAAATASLLAGAALAQTGDNTMKPAPAPMMKKAEPVQPSGPGTAAALAEQGKGITMAKSTSLAARFITAKPAEIATSKLVGLDVYNKQNEKLGEIEDLTIENGKTITGVVVSVGGFLGMGERYVLIDPATVVVDAQDGGWKAFVDTTKDTLKNAPTYDYSQAKS